MTSIRNQRSIRLRNAVFAVVLILLVAGCGKEEAPEQIVARPVKAIKVGDVAQVGGRSFPGQAKATQEVNLSFRVSGPLITFPVKVGDEVEQGRVLARIDPRDYQVNLSNVQGQLDRAKAKSARAESEYKRELKIFQEDPGATSKAAVDRKREQRDSARADIKSLEASVAAAKDQLSYTYLRAPYKGMITATYVENFEDVRPKQAIVRVLDPSRIEMIINIPENLISNASYVTKVFVRFDAFPEQEIEATIKEIGREASQTTRTYPVTLIMDQPQGIKILPGMAGKTVRVEGDLPDQVTGAGIEVPVSATFSPDESGKTYLWVIDDQTKTVKRREIKTGRLTDRGITVQEGLKAGEWVATAGAHYLREGQQVRILDENPKGRAE
jgi:RND family efflux transporter MFP subunit